MDYINEGVGLGIDLIILGLCVNEYITCKRHVNNIKNAPHLPLDGALKEFVGQQAGKKVPYAILRGTVTPVGVPLRSVMTPGVTGVVQIIRLNEHRVTRGFAGFWAEQRKLMHIAANQMPFKIQQNGYGVEITDALAAAILDLDVVYDNYEPASLSLFDHIFGFFSGVRQRGFQTTEEVLRDGSFLTAIGELELDGNTLRLQPSTIGPMFLTNSNSGTLLKRFESGKTSMILRMAICGLISVVLVGSIVRKVYRKRKQQREEREIKETLERERRSRRARTRQVEELPMEQLCVVCSSNPKEIIILPCGHVCICEDCSEKITYNCPVCRGRIHSKAAAFIS